MKTPGKILLAIAAVWIVVGGTVKWSRSQRVTPESLMTYVEKNPLSGLPPTAREKVIDRVAGQINALDFSQREELRKKQVDRTFFQQLTAEERRRFLELTLPEGFRQLMLSLNAMSPEKRRKLVDRALQDMKEADPEARGQVDRVDRADVEKIAAMGMEAFYSDASAEVKLDFAPVIERLQQATKGFR